MRSNIQNLRKDYTVDTLLEKALQDDPIEQFKLWFDQALEANVPEPNAMTLATADSDGKPSARIVLLKGIGQDGFVFYTNYQSHKGKELKENPQAALVFHWHQLQRQIRIEGQVEMINEEASTTYFQSRPKGSQIGAWASPQSQAIGSRKLLEDNVRRLENEYKDVEQLPRPSHWGGYRVIPEKIEFWQGRSSRLHDRIQYEKEGKKWKVSRLAP